MLISADRVIEIRKTYNETNLTYVELSKKFNMSSASLWKVLKNKKLDELCGHYPVHWRGRYVLHKPFPEETVKRAKQLWKMGWTQGEIGAELKINPGSVWQLVHKRSLPSSPPLRYKPRKIFYSKYLP